MTYPGPGDAPYVGPPPTRRPEPWEQTPAYWPPVAGPVHWGQPVRWSPPLAPPSAMRWAPPPGTPPHEVPRPFLLAMRSRDWGWWRPLLGLLLFSVVYGLGVVLSLVLGIVGLVASSAGAPSDSQLEDLAEPAVLLLTNVATIVAIPVVWLVWAVVHGMRIGWSSSVLGRLRMRLFPLYAGVALVTLGPIICLSLLPTLLGAPVVEPVASFGWLVVVVLLTTPLQSAAEEYLFRGYLSQAIAGWVGRPVAGAVVAGLITATAFSLAHLPPDLPTFLQRFAVGLAASAVVWLTGGLEAAIALHAVNNVVVFLLAGALSGGADTSLVTDREPWRDVALMCLALSAFVALVARSNRRLRPETHTAGLDLRGPGRPVPVPAG